MESSCGKGQHDFTPRESKFRKSMQKKNEWVAGVPSGEDVVSQLCGLDVKEVMPSSRGSRGKSAATVVVIVTKGGLGVFQNATER
jgi:hypothetical protein